MRRLLIAGIALLVLAAGSLIWSRRQDGAARATPAADATPHGEAREAAEPGDPGDDEADDAASVPTVEIRGTLVVVEEDGRHLTAESGSLSTPYGDFEVARGTWRAAVPLGASLAIEDVLLGERRAIPDPETIEIPPDGVVEVHCRWFVPARLRVVGEKGEDLLGVEIAVRNSDEIVPVDDPKIVEAGSSPVTVPGEVAGNLQYWVRARGHAWMRIALAQGYGGERVVRLVRAGTLEARLVPFDPEGEVALHVWRGDEHVLGWSPDESGLCRIEGLPPGRLELRAATGFWWEERVIATAEVGIEPGKTTEVSLSLRDAPRPPEPVLVEGTLHVDPGWPVPVSSGFCGLGTVLRITIDGGTRPEAEMEEDGRWSAELVPGMHYFTVEPWAWTQAIEVGPRGTTGARLVVPPPCKVELHLVDAVTGEAIPDEDHVSWHVTSGHVECWLERRYLACAEPGVWRFEAPVGTLAVRLWNDLHDAETEVDLKPGTNRIALKAAHNLSCDLALKDGALAVPLDVEPSDAVRATALDGDGALDSVAEGFPCRAWFTKPGRYRLSLPAIEGYEPVAPIEVEIAAGKMPIIEVPLTRSPR